ncbi:hypothetical protein [Actinomadura sp. CNU-125]|uniref:hypothetical protein n=1 Tax=Actinomadura sp. CNU-125 TaxID=1904961 RepID=UPI001300EF08|nr:hypothetical protein [Actinomadura sp. CNU-125]
MAESADGRKTVYLHVGAPTAGAAFLHRALWANRRRLADAGVGHPVTGPNEHFGAVMDLREMSWGGHRDPAWDGAWDRVARRAREWDGPTVVFSHGLLGGASAAQARHAVATLEPAEVHVVFATRDLGCSSSSTGRSRSATTTTSRSSGSWTTWSSSASTRPSRSGRCSGACTTRSGC